MPITACCLLAILLATPALSAPVSAQSLAHSDTHWRELLNLAREKKQPVVVFFRSADCDRCGEFERSTVNHPAIQRRLPAVVYAVRSIDATPPAAAWGHSSPGLALFDRTGALRARWKWIPDTTNFGVILDSIVAVADHLEKGAFLAETLGPADGEVEIARALARLGRIAEARSTLARARSQGSRETKLSAVIAAALFDLAEKQPPRSISELDRVIAEAVSPAIAAEAWMTLGVIHHAARATGEAIAAFEQAAAIAPAGSELQASARNTLKRLRSGPLPETTPPIQLLPIGRQVVAGRHPVRTRVSSTAVARATFALDGVVAGTTSRPPYSMHLDFGSIPRRRLVRVEAFDPAGKRIGSDEMVVNDAGETFWVRLEQPAGETASGAVRAVAGLRLPPDLELRRLVFSWNESERATLTKPPWETRVSIPAGELGVLRVVAELEDGRLSEDARVLNAPGFTVQSIVQLVEVPITLTSGAAPPSPKQIIMRENDRIRPVESVATAEETPLTIGLLIDVSASMQRTLPDVQEAAIRFVETMLGSRDRAFLIAFASGARLVQPATADAAQLRNTILQLRPEGSTALHDAIALGLLQFEGVKGRRALVVFSDGIDRTSRYALNDVREIARRIHVPIHVMAARLDTPVEGNGASAPAPAASPYGDPFEWARAYGDLERLAETSGGTANRMVELGRLAQSFSEIERALRAQILAFFRTEPAARDQEWRPLSVELEGGAALRAPEGYYARP